MSITRKYNFSPNNIIFPNEWAAEIDQLCSLLSGLLPGRLILNLETPPINPSLFINNIDGTVLIDFKKNNVSKIKILKNLQIQSLVTDVAPFDVNSTTMIANLNAQFLDNLPIATFKTANKFVEWYIPFIFVGTPVVNDKADPIWIVPSGTTMTLTEFHTSVFRNQGLDIPSEDAFFTVDLKKNGVTISSITLNDSVNINWVTQNVINVAIVENDIITVVINATTGTTKAANIECRVKFKQKLIT